MRVSATPAIPEEITITQSLLFMPIILTKKKAISKNDKDTRIWPEPRPILKAEN